MKILQVIDTFNSGGAERICITLSNLLKARGNEVAVMVLLEGGDLVYLLNTGIPLIDLNRKGKYHVWTMYKCAQILKEYDLIHVHMRHNYRYIKVIQRLFFVKSKVILHDHFGNVDRDSSVPLGFQSFLKPSFYIGVSKSLTQWAHEHLGISKSRVFLLANTIVKQEVKPVACKKGLVLVGNIKPIKNQLFAIRLMSNIENTLTIYGAVHDAAYFQLLLDEIERLGVQDKVRFIHDCTRIQAELPKYEMGLQTALSESGPLVLIEYLAQGVLFLTYQTGEVVKTIEEELPELIMTSFEAKDWLVGIRENISGDQEKLKSIYLSKFNEKHHVEACERIYHSILAL